MIALPNYINLASDEIPDILKGAVLEAGCQSRKVKNLKQPWFD